MLGCCRVAVDRSKTHRIHRRIRRHQTQVRPLRHLGLRQGNCDLVILVDPRHHPTGKRRGINRIRQKGYQLRASPLIDRPDIVRDQQRHRRLGTHLQLQARPSQCPGLDRPGGHGRGLKFHTHHPAVNLVNEELRPVECIPKRCSVRERNLHTENR